MYDFFDIYNRANEKVEHCKEIDAVISKTVKREDLTTPIKKEVEKKY